MYVIHEENHEDLCVVKEIFHGIIWLIKENWLDYETIGIHEDDTEFTLKDIIPNCEDKETWRISFFFHNKTDKERIEIMERFGFYFHTIDYFEI